MNKQHILDEIKRTAVQNGGVPLGRMRFETETGIKESDWSGRFWARWSDAVLDAGFTSNKLNAAHDERDVLKKLAELTLELSRFPTAAEMKLRRQHDPAFPSKNAVYNRFVSKSQLARQLMTYCATQPAFADVVELCRPIAVGAAVDEDADEADKFEVGYVYLALMKIGREKRFKIGKANLVEQRTRQVAVNLPEELELIHAISTDDAYGIEAYWHKRFADKRRGGEWFELTADDVRVFKRRKFM